MPVAIVIGAAAHACMQFCSRSGRHAIPSWNASPRARARRTSCATEVRHFLLLDSSKECNDHARPRQPRQAAPGLPAIRMWDTVQLSTIGRQQHSTLSNLVRTIFGCVASERSQSPMPHSQPISPNRNNATRAAGRIAQESGRCTSTCPLCKSSVVRVRRRFVDRLVNLLFPIRRYRCQSFLCRWEGNLGNGAQLSADGQWGAAQQSNAGALRRTPMPSNRVE
jgi:hypothetical protein